MFRLSLVAGMLLAAAVLAACGGGGSSAREVAVSLKEWSVTPSTEETTNGKVRFQVKNDGTTPHEFVVVKSDLPPNELLVVLGRAAEDQLNVVDRLPPFAAGSATPLELDLSPGKYLLLCNLVELPPGQPPVSHYGNGMVAFFLVEPD